MKTMQLFRTAFLIAFVFIMNGCEKSESSPEHCKTCHGYTTGEQPITQSACSASEENEFTSHYGGSCN